ncbi:MAG: hypothetical protein KBT83_07385 [Marinobacter sp.]|nr:hypothetical protein [Marinobacter sp.]
MRPHTAPEKQHSLSLETGGEVVAGSGREDTPVVHDRLMERVLERDNLRRAFRQVKRNKGSAGIDGMTVDDLSAFVQQHWSRIGAQLLAGTYRPQPVRQVEIPKPKGGVRKLGIPTVLDRLIQQALLQVLQAEWDRSFSHSSYGFRPGRSAHQAIHQAQRYINKGYRWTVGMDLEKWVRRKLRCYHLKQWGRSGYRQLRKRGVSVRLAWNTAKSAHGPWRLSQSPGLRQALPRQYFASLGLPDLVER